MTNVKLRCVVWVGTGDGVRFRWHIDVWVYMGTMLARMEPPVWRSYKSRKLAFAAAKRAARRILQDRLILKMREVH